MKAFKPERIILATIAALISLFGAFGVLSIAHKIYTTIGAQFPADTAFAIYCISAFVLSWIVTRIFEDYKGDD
ncbi:Uncharacterised protein [Acinetobacter baumannii]|nr:Uncharacterised protein [Acinetobacter baumannii]